MKRCSGLLEQICRVTSFPFHICNHSVLSKKLTFLSLRKKITLLTERLLTYLTIWVNRLALLTAYQDSHPGEQSHSRNHNQYQ